MTGEQGALNTLTATAVKRAVAAGEVTATAVAEAVAHRIAERQETVRAYVGFDRERLLDEAKRADTTAVRRPLDGVTVAVKDTIATRDLPTGYNSRRYVGTKIGIDAACVDTLRRHGALIVGKTVTTEFAATTRGAETRNPHDAGFSPGGSSSGSAAAVADGQAAIAIGSQTGGSVIRPASYCGVFGWKPSWGAVSAEGIKTYAPSCDTVGFFARSAADLQMLAELYRLPAPPPVPEHRRLRIAMCHTPFWDRAQDATREALAEAARRLRASGAEVGVLDLPPEFGALDAARITIVGHEGAVSLCNETFNDVPPSPDIVAALAAGARDLTPERIRAAYRHADICRAAFDDLAGKWDAVLAPSTTGEAPFGLVSTGSAVFNALWSMLHVPVVNVPGLRGRGGLPVGVSLVGARHDDVRLLTIAERLAMLMPAVPAE